MSCGFSREMLALHIEGDLPDADAATTARHLAWCADCRRFLEELHLTQGLMKALRRETVSPAACTAMRRDVMTIINERPDALGWGVRIERAITLGLRPSFGMAALLLLGILSASALAQLRPVTHAGVATDSMSRPDGYREWILVAGGGVVEPSAERPISGDRVYINPSSYREYSQKGRFPDGTVLVWEPAAPGQALTRRSPHGTSSTLLVSVKDSTKFEGGWGFYDFSGAPGAGVRTARPLPESSGCRTCHQQSAAKDPVFTRVSLHVGGSRAILSLYPFDGTPYDTSIYQDRRDGAGARGGFLRPDVVQPA